MWDLGEERDKKHREFRGFGWGVGIERGSDKGGLIAMATSRRAYLEMLKFSCASDVLFHLAYVSRLFASLSTCDELWYSLLDAYPSLPGFSPKEQYLIYAKGYLPVLSPTSLRKYYVQASLWQACPLSEEVSISRQMSIVITIDHLVFVTGGPKARRDTFTIHPSSGLVKYLSPLLQHRRSMGAIRYDRDIYTFGGINLGYEASAEVFGQEVQTWRKLKDCQAPRSAFNPAAYRTRIYLLGGCSTVSTEYFDVISESCHLLPLVLPGMRCTIALCTDTELIAVQKTGYYVCNIEEIPKKWEITPFDFEFGKAFKSDCPVIAVGDTYYIHQSYASRVIALQLAARTYTEVPTGVIPLNSPKVAS